MSHKINKYDKMFLTHRQRDCYTFNVIDNNCLDIEVNDSVEIDSKTYLVESLEWSVRLFDDIDGNPVRGTNVTILINQNEDE